MAQLPRHVRLYKKAEAALIAAIEIYNKPDFKYREETFAILAVNAWEILLKARLLQVKKDDLRVLRVYEKKMLPSGQLSQKLYVKKNRAGNAFTIGYPKAITELDSDATTRISPAVTTNINALAEIRDNAVHFVNAS